MRLPTPALSALLVLLVAPDLGAQQLRPSGTGLSVAVTASAVRATAESRGISTASTGMAPRFEVSYGATPRLSLTGAFVTRGARIEDADYDVRSVDLGLRYLGHAGSRWRPFGEAGFGVRRFSLDGANGTITATNVGPFAAAGYVWFPGGAFALEAAATFGRVSFDSWRVDGAPTALASVSHQELGIRAGARWFLRAR